MCPMWNFNEFKLHIFDFKTLKILQKVNYHLKFFHQRYPLASSHQRFHIKIIIAVRAFAFDYLL